METGNRKTLCSEQRARNEKKEVRLILPVEVRIDDSLGGLESEREGLCRCLVLPAEGYGLWRMQAMGLIFHDDVFFYSITYIVVHSFYNALLTLKFNVNTVEIGLTWTNSLNRSK